MQLVWLSLLLLALTHPPACCSSLGTLPLIFGSRGTYRPFFVRQQIDSVPICAEADKGMADTVGKKSEKKDTVDGG